MRRFWKRDEFGNSDIIGLETGKMCDILSFEELNLLTKAFNRLGELEDKVESGEIVDRNAYLDYLMTVKNTSELTDKELEFFVKHNASVREDTDAENIALREKFITAVKDVAERIKMAFYYEFEELIPSIMADKIDEIVKEVLK